MAARNRTPISPSHRRPHIPSSPLSAFRSSPLAVGSLGSGPLGSYPVTASSFSSSPVFSFTQAASSPSPDLFDDFTYSEDMDSDFCRIDSESATQLRQADQTDLPQNDAVHVSPPTVPRDQKTWVVFRGAIPGIYEDGMSAAIQTQGFSDAFQRLFPDRDSAETAWLAYMQDGTYPEYGRSPWVVYLGRKPGVYNKITDLECSVRGYRGAIFRSCSSVTDANIKFHLFMERVTQMFAGPDPFSNADGLTHQPEAAGNLREMTPTIEPISPPLVAPKPLPAPQYAPESSKSAGKRVATSSKPITHGDGPSSPIVSPLRGSGIPPLGDGWYVAFHAALPGVYCGSEALKEARPRPGGFLCAPEKESADRLFLNFALEGAVVWARGPVGT